MAHFHPLFHIANEVPDLKRDLKYFFKFYLAMQKISIFCDINKLLY